MSAQKPMILLIDDDDDLRRALAEQLEQCGEYAVECAATMAEGVDRAREGRAELILMDVNLPDGDGRDACRNLRDEGIAAPILMLTSLETDEDQVDGLDAGANDYITKPFRFAVLLARIRAHLRSHENSEDAIFRIGPYQFRPGAKALFDERQKRIRLTEKETNILKYLYRAGQKSVTRDELLREVWGYNASVTTHTLETHIYRLRQKIEPQADSPKLLITETGGYRLAP
jgi:DNA-binding response OmpR family regulator